MNAAQQRALAAFRRCQAFVDAHLASADNGGDAACATLRETIQKIDELCSQQERSRLEVRADVKRQRLLARVIRRNHLHPLLRALRGCVGATQAAELELASDRLAARSLVEACARIAAIAEPCRDSLTAMGMPPVVHDDLVAIAAALEQSLDARDHQRCILSAASKLLDAEMARGRHTIASVESVVLRAYEEEPRLVAAWQQARRMVDPPPEAL